MEISLMATRIFKNRWWVVVASMVSGTVGAGTVMVYATSIYLKPVGEELHIGRGEFSTATGLAILMMSLSTPVLGRLIDRYGMRVVMLPAIALFALATAGLSLATASMGVLLTLFAIQGVFASVQTPTGYSKMITARFDDKRGLALGFALSGQGVGTVLIPQYVRFLVEHYGWRTGYIGLGSAILVLAFIPVALLFAEPEEMKRDRELARQNGSGDNPALPGITLTEALRNWKYWALTMAIFLSLMVTSGSLAHMVPMLTDRGISVDTAVAALSISGAAMAIGRLISGYLMDKIFAIYVATFFLVVPIAGIGILLSGASKFWMIAAVVLIGLLIGAEFDVMAFLVSRYFGIRAFGVLYGFMLMFVEAANAVGMLLMGWCFQLKHSYVPMLCIFEVVLVIAIVLMFSMGPYRYPAPSKQREAVATAH
jgi:MFS family permease